jgi:hypothetical protein
MPRLSLVLFPASVVSVVGATAPLVLTIQSLELWMVVVWVGVRVVVDGSCRDGDNEDAAGGVCRGGGGAGIVAPGSGSNVGNVKNDDRGGCRIPRVISQ